MKNELQSLTNLIRLPITKHDANPEQRKLEFKCECNIIKDMILQQVFASDTKLKTTAYIRYHHKELIALMDSFYRRCEDVVMAESLLQPMADLLQYLEVHFEDEIDFGTTICKLNLVQFQQKLETRKQVMIRHFRKHDVPDALVNVLLNHFTKLQQAASMTYATYHYHQLLLADLERFVAKRVRRNYSDQLYILLGRLNFNTVHFMAHCRNQILEDVQKAAKKDSQLDILSNYIKRIKLIQLKPNFGFDPETSTVTEVLCAWILEEKVFIENRKMRQDFPAAAPQLQEKIELDLSVGQLGLLLKILIGSGLISNVQLHKVLIFFTTYFKTRKASQISTESLRNNYYNVDANTVSSLKAKMIVLLNALNKMK